jgi:hypothetical protein
VAAEFLTHKFFSYSTDGLLTPGQQAELYGTIPQQVQIIVVRCRKVCLMVDGIQMIFRGSDFSNSGKSSISWQEQLCPAL